MVLGAIGAPAPVRLLGALVPAPHHGEPVPALTAGEVALLPTAVLHKFAAIALA